MFSAAVVFSVWNVISVLCCRDVAIMDEDGYVMISGRIKDMIIRGGENIYPAEIEQFLYKHPAIEDVQIIGEDMASS